VVAVGGWHELFERRSGALECGLDRVHAAVEHLGDLRGVEAEHVAKHERCSLSGWEVLERCDERQLDRFSGLIARVGSRRSVEDALQQNVWVGLDPGGLADSGWFGRVEREVQRGWWSAAGVPERVQTAIGCDPVQPGAHRRSLLEALEATPGPQQRFL
jgi:hypothetical protein